MPHNIDGAEYLTIEEAVAYMGCTDGWVRNLLREKKLRGKRIGERLWLVSVESAKEQKAALTTRANANRHLAKRPLAARKTVKKAARRRK
jgi:excisionase family DNA binding protein